MHTLHGIHMLLTDTPITCMLMCTLVHIVDVRATLLNFVMIEHGPKKLWVPKTTPIVYDVGVGSHMT